MAPNKKGCKKRKKEERNKDEKNDRKTREHKRRPIERKSTIMQSLRWVLRIGGKRYHVTKATRKKEKTGDVNVDRQLKKRRWAVRKKLEGWKTKKIYESLQIPRRTFYNWWRRYQEEGWKGLEEKSRRPLNPNRKLNEDLVELIMKIRREKFYGPNKIEIELRKKGVEVGHTTIYKVLKRKGLNNMTRRVPGLEREDLYWKEENKEIWQYKVKGVVQNEFN